jgi:MFS-type transporter involved in bile tolerance (Atg22 family)
MKHRPTIAGFALLGALLGGIVANVFGDKAHPQLWITVLGYAVAALLVIFLVLVLSGFAALVRRTFEGAHRLHH